MGSRECFEEQLGLYLLITWPASCLEGTNNSHLPFVVAAIAWHTVMTCIQVNIPDMELYEPDGVDHLGKVTCYTSNHLPHLCPL